jgi:hypothetical protein
MYEIKITKWVLMLRNYWHVIKLLPQENWCASGDNVKIYNNNHSNSNNNTTATNANDNRSSVLLAAVQPNENTAQ